MGWGKKREVDISAEPKRVGDEGGEISRKCRGRRKSGGGSQPQGTVPRLGTIEGKKWALGEVGRGEGLLGEDPHAGNGGGGEGRFDQEFGGCHKE